MGEPGQAAYLGTSVALLFGGCCLYQCGWICGGGEDTKRAAMGARKQRKRNEQKKQKQKQTEKNLLRFEYVHKENARSRAEKAIGAARDRGHVDLPSSSRPEPEPEPEPEQKENARSRAQKAIEAARDRGHVDLSSSSRPEPEPEQNPAPSVELVFAAWKGSNERRPNDPASEPVNASAAKTDEESDPRSWLTAAGFSAPEIRAIETHYTQQGAPFTARDLLTVGVDPLRKFVEGVRPIEAQDVGEEQLKHRDGASSTTSQRQSEGNNGSVEYELASNAHFQRLHRVRHLPILQLCRWNFDLESAGRVCRRQRSRRQRSVGKN
jgi:hypothetical protein